MVARALLQTTVPASYIGTWSETGAMTTAHSMSSVARLKDGKVLVISGYSDSRNSTLTAVTDLYNPGTGRWTQTGTVSQPQSS